MTRACLLGPASDHMACDSAESHDMLQVVPLPLEMRSMLAVNAGYKSQDMRKRSALHALRSLVLRKSFWVSRVCQHKDVSVYMYVEERESLNDMMATMNTTRTETCLRTSQVCAWGLHDEGRGLGCRAAWCTCPCSKGHAHHSHHVGLH